MTPYHDAAVISVLIALFTFSNKTATFCFTCPHLLDLTIYNNQKI